MSSLRLANEEYMAEFPFIKPWVRELGFPSCPSVIRVQRLDYHVLIAEPDGSDLGYPARQYFCIGKDGTVLCQVRPARKDYDNGSFWRPSTWFGRMVRAETVENALLGLREEDRLAELAYVVEVVRCGRQITIYKLPKGVSMATSTELADFAERERRKARQEILMGIQSEIQASQNG